MQTARRPRELWDRASRYASGVVMGLALAGGCAPEANDAWVNLSEIDDGVDGVVQLEADGRPTDYLAPLDSGGTTSTAYLAAEAVSSCPSSAKVVYVHIATWYDLTPPDELNATYKPNGCWNWNMNRAFSPATGSHAWGNCQSNTQTSNVDCYSYASHSFMGFLPWHVKHWGKEWENGARPFVYNESTMFHTGTASAYNCGKNYMGEGGDVGWIASCVSDLHWYNYANPGRYGPLKGYEYLRKDSSTAPDWHPSGSGQIAMGFAELFGADNAYDPHLATWVSENGAGYAVGRPMVNIVSKSYASGTRACAYKHVKEVCTTIGAYKFMSVWSGGYNGYRLDHEDLDMYEAFIRAMNDCTMHVSGNPYGSCSSP